MKHKLPARIQRFLRWLFGALFEYLPPVIRSLPNYASFRPGWKRSNIALWVLYHPSLITMTRPNPANVTDLRDESNLSKD